MDLNTEFCKEVGIKPAVCYLVNAETGEARFYANISGLYKKPAGWKKIEQYKFEKPKYPNVITNEVNFLNILNIQWYMFGEMGDIYKRDGQEPFQYNYIKTRLTAMKMTKSFGGGEMLDEYKKALRDIPFDYLD